jgi:hypothetical protein
MKRPHVTSVLVVGLVACGHYLSAAGGTSASPLELRVTPFFVSSPATVTATVRVEPDSNNRLLRIALDSDAYGRSSDIPLDGADAPRMHSFRWSALPPGVYEVSVEVHKTGDRRVTTRTQHIEVVGVGILR